MGQMSTMDNPFEFAVNWEPPPHPQLPESAAGGDRSGPPRWCNGGERTGGCPKMLRKVKRIKLEKQIYRRLTERALERDR